MNTPQVQPTQAYYGTSVTTTSPTATRKYWPSPTQLHKHTRIA